MTKTDPTILVVEDNDAIRSLIVMVLEDDYRIVTAADVASAFELAESERVLDLAISDINLPGGTGPELIGRIAVLHPAMKAVFISGGRPGPGIDRDDPNRAFLPKPFGAGDLRNAVRDLLARDDG